MSQRRMFSPDIICSDEFLEMPATTRDLYYQLAIRADDDGFVQPKLIMKVLGSSEDDLRILIAKRFTLPFESGVLVIKHWLIHNMIRKDRYKPTRFIEEKKMLQIKENGAYTEVGCQNDNQLAPQVRLGKVRLEEIADSEAEPAPKKISEHRQFVTFFYETTMKVRGVKPVITGADGKNLKRVLDMKILTTIELQQAATFFLVDPQYRKFSPTISTFLSSGILTGIANTMKNRGSDFWKLISDWQTSVQPIESEDGVKSPESMPDRILEMKAALMDKMNLKK